MIKGMILQKYKICKVIIFGYLFIKFLARSPIAHSEKRNPAQNKFRMGSDGDEGGHGEAEAEEHAPSVFWSGC
jgi:hypothetical protein